MASQDGFLIAPFSAVTWATPVNLGSVGITDTASYNFGFDAGADAGFVSGELYGFASPREDVMEPIKPGETDANKKTVSFYLYTSTGLPASGLVGEGAVLVPGVSDVQLNRDLAGFVNFTGTFSHIADGKYRYTFANAEVEAAGGEGNIELRIKAIGYRTMTMTVPLRYVAVDSIAVAAAGTIRDAVLNALLQDHAVVGSVADGVAIAAGLLQGNYMVDETNNSSPNGQTAARIRIWRSAAAMAGATAGGSGLQGAFAAFSVATTYTGPNKIASHTVTRTA